MLSEMSIQQYRAMSPRERFALFKGLLDFSMQILLHRPREHQVRVREAWRTLDERSHQAFLEHLGRFS